MKSKRLLLIVGIIAWMVFLFFPAFLFSTIQPAFNNLKMNPALTGIFIAHSMLVVFYYFNYYYAIPKFYFTKKYKIYVLILAGCLSLLVLVMEYNEAYSPFYNSNLKYGHLLFFLSLKIRFIMILLLSLGIATYNRLLTAEEEKLKSELSYLKAQINPHFLFNTLNSIYALTVKKSDAAPESVTKLSSIMRYVISDAAADFVSLDKEMNYVSSYIELEKLRITAKVNLLYEFKGEFAGKQIAPLIFIPFIENAFKYGVSTSDNSNIQITIAIQNNELKMRVYNTKAANKAPAKPNTRLGIETTRKRLNLIYPNNHTLNIKDEEKDFTVELSMNLEC